MDDPKTAAAQIDRTSALGLFNTGRSFWRSAEQLRSAPPKVTHPDPPQTFLFCHSIELYLKAFLRGAGVSVDDLKKIGHRISKLGNEAAKGGLTLSLEHAELLAHIEETDVAIEARYIVTGFKQQPTMEALSGLAEALDRQVGDSLISFGFAVREQRFEAPTIASADLDEDTERVLSHLFKAEHDDRDVRLMARTLSISEPMLRYHLDQLCERDLGTPSSFTDDAEYWSITPAGRKYVVARKLMG
jgi:hypothetical protein